MTNAAPATWSERRSCVTRRCHRLASSHTLPIWRIVVLGALDVLVPELANSGGRQIARLEADIGRCGRELRARARPCRWRRVSVETIAAGVPFGANKPTHR